MTYNEWLQLDIRYHKPKLLMKLASKKKCFQHYDVHAFWCTEIKETSDTLSTLVTNSHLHSFF